MQSSTRLVVVLAVATTVANVGMLLSYFTTRQQPVLVSREFLDHPGFRKAVETITQAHGYLREADVEKIVEQCRIVDSKIKCD